MSNSSNIATLPNPYTSLAYLTPDLANQLEIYRYVAVATLGAFTWHVLSHVDIHYKLLFRSRITLATVAYFTSILSTISYICCCVAFHVGIVKNCQALVTGLASLYMVTYPAISMLFLLRVRAIYAGNKFVTGFFVLCWLALTGLAITLPLSLYGSHIGPTSHCIDAGAKPITPAPIIAAAVYDSLIFFFISWRLLNNTMAGDSLREKSRAFFGRGGLPALSRALLYSGQVYYLISLFSNIATVVLILTPSTPALLHGLLNIPNSALTCAMACKVYTSLKFESHQDTSSIGFSSSFIPAPRQTTNQHTQFSSHLPQPPVENFEKLTFNGVYPSRDAVIFQQGSRETFPSSESSCGQKLDV